MDIRMKIIRSRRKSIGIEISPDLTVTVRAPYYASDKEIREAVKSKEKWLVTHIEKMKERTRTQAVPQEEKMTMDQIRELGDKALKVIPPKVKAYANRMGVTYGRITIRNQKTRWGSCSSKGNLNFNCLLMLMPEEIVDYVVVHELAHRKEMNHSPAFWREVEKVMPDYKEKRKWLKENGSKYMNMMV